MSAVTVLHHKREYPLKLALVVVFRICLLFTVKKPNSLPVQAVWQQNTLSGNRKVGSSTPYCSAVKSICASRLFKQFRTSRLFKYHWQCARQHSSQRTLCVAKHFVDHRVFFRFFGLLLHMHPFSHRNHSNVKMFSTFRTFILVFNFLLLLIRFIILSFFQHFFPIEINESTLGRGIIITLLWI